MVPDDYFSEPVDSIEMRVAFLVWQAPVYSEVFIYHQMVALQAEGVEVELHSLRTTEDDGDDFSSLNSEVQSVIAHDRMPNWRRFRGKIAEIGFWSVLCSIAALVIRLARVRLQRRDEPSEYYLRRQFLDELNWLVSPQFDVVHCQFFFLLPRLYEVQRVGSLGRHCSHSNPVIVCSLRGYGICVFSKTLALDQIAAFDSIVDVYLSNSYYMKMVGETRGLPVKKMERLFTGVNSALFSRTEDYRRVSVTSREMLFVGRLHPKKGVDVLLKSFAAVLREQPGVTLTIVGEGVERPFLEELATSLQIADSVTFTGKLSQSTIVTLLNRALLFLCCCSSAANEDADGPVNVIKEAMAMQVPVVTTASGGIPELGVHERCGLEVPPDDVQLFSEAVLLLLRNPERRLEFSDKARELVSGVFDSATITDQLMKSYRRVLERSSESS